MLIPGADAQGRTGQRETCWHCNGGGVDWGETCLTCGGYGWIREEVPVIEERRNGQVATD